MIKHLLMWIFIGFCLIGARCVVDFETAVLIGIAGCWLELMHITEQTKK